MDGILAVAYEWFGDDEYDWMVFYHAPKEEDTKGFRHVVFFRVPTVEELYVFQRTHLRSGGKIVGVGRLLDSDIRRTAQDFTEHGIHPTNEAMLGVSPNPPRRVHDGT
jgi:hypothetical protein